MSSAITKTGIKLFARHLEQYTPADPLYEEYVDKRGRTKRRKRELPLGLSDRDAAILRSVKRRAHYLDKGFKLCGIRFGWTFIIGIIPGVGDAADVTLGYLLVVRKARTADIPRWLTQRMILNLAIATSVGLIPLLGDILLAAFRANSRNAALLEEFLRLRGEGPMRTAETSASANKGITLRDGHDKPLAIHEAGQDADDNALAPPERKRSWSSQPGASSSSDADDKGKNTNTHSGSSEVIRHRDSRFVEDIS